MKKHIFYLTIYPVVLMSVLIACPKEQEQERDDPVITMSMQQTGDMSVAMYGSGMVTIDWDDGSPEEEQTLWFHYGPHWDAINFYIHKYSDDTFRTIIIKGNYILGVRCSLMGLTILDVSKNTRLEYLDCTANQLTKLDVSNNIELKYLYCYFNQLTDLDVSKSTRLTGLDVSYNQLSAFALNRLFETLHGNNVNQGKWISIYGNPGSDDCNPVIAKSKGWFVNQ